MARQDLKLCGLFILLPFFFLSGTLTSSQTFFMRDLTYLFHPWRALSAQFMQTGEMPLWNSYQMGGMPLLANGQSSVLYPGTVLFYIWGFVPALKMFHGLHYALASLGFFMLGRKLGFSRAASFAVSVLWAYNGYLLTRLEFLSIAGCVIWLPWCLLFVSDIERSPSLSMAGIAVSSTLSFLSGFPQIFLMQAVMVSAFCLVRHPRAASAKTLALGFLIFLLLSAPLGVPMMELWRHSIRSGAGIEASDATRYSLTARSLAGLVSPLFMSVHKDQFTGEKYFWIWSAWWGFSGTVLILSSLARMRTRLFLFSGTFFVLGALWSMGGHVPWFRYPPVALYWTVASACLLSLLGLRALGKNPLALIASAALIFELQAYSSQIHATIHSSYFQATFANVRAIQMDRPGTALLSPKVEMTRRLPGVTSAAAAMKFRAFLFDLTNLPYRIRTLNPSGEPLALAGYKNLWMRFRGRSFDELIPGMNLLNLTHFLSEEDPGKGWELVSGDEGLKVYRNLEALGEIFALDGSGKVLPATAVRMENDRQEAAFDLPERSLLITHIPRYPGWTVYCREHGAHEAGGDPPSILQDFLTAELAPGAHHLHIAYSSGSWKLGVALFLAGLTALLGFMLL
ncbi:MAG: hypothetical protein A3A86_02020 [Elusimicrobia bacterium RIFCSPLOWO2_01_FULL_60_11]|nr:MAG: hypothetical protein A3A86_02020 [Elusimicrobia bacterium RIFCSPLOWO2_01_FULL_60_11]